MKSSSAAAADLVGVVLFAVVGRSSHSEAETLAGVFHTAWPFLTGCVTGLVLSRSWRAPLSPGVGVVVWLCTVAGGVALRLLSGATAQTSFVIVATITLGVLILGWRAVVRLVHRARAARTQKESAAL